MTISIHALRKESDSTPSDCQPNPFISIHALRKESDAHRTQAAHLQVISIHALRKESDEFQWVIPIRMLFQSTLSVRRATTISSWLFAFQ